MSSKVFSIKSLVTKELEEDIDKMQLADASKIKSYVRTQVAHKREVHFPKTSSTGKGPSPMDLDHLGKEKGSENQEEEQGPGEGGSTEDWGGQQDPLYALKGRGKGTFNGACLFLWGVGSQSSGPSKERRIHGRAQG